jgi:ribonuclease Z
VVLEDSEFEVIAFPVSHRGPSLGYLFREKSRRPFLADRAEALDVPQGPERSRLVAGESVELSDGRMIQPDDVLGPPERHASLAHVGDTGETADLVEHVHGADLLVIEATYLERDAELADQFDHLTAAQAARLARQADVHQLVLTHISRRYRESDVLEEAQAIMPNTVVARDLDRYRVLRENVERERESHKA